jgi:histone deacetylase 11
MAMHRGWSINLGGGFHHASRCHGGGFCVYADITLALKQVMMRYSSRIKRVMIIDLDAHQGNGHERDFADDSEVFIFDA